MKHLEEKKNDLITRAEELLNQAKADERDLTEEEKTELEKIRDDIKAIKKTLGLEEDIKAEKDLEEKKETQEDETKMTAEENKRAIEEAEKKSFENFVRGYVVHERAGELPKTGNTAVIPTTIANKIIKKVYDISPILERADRYNVKGNLDLPYYDTDTSTITVAYQTEFTAMSSSSGSFKSVSLTGFLAGALTKISRSLINNAQFDIVNFIVDEMAYAIKRFIEKELLVGTTDKVTGLSTLTNAVETAASTAVTADEIIKLHDAVKDDYQAKAIWIMSSATRTALRMLKDSQGRYLLQDDLSTPFGVSLLGKPVYVSDNMADIAAGNTIAYYGDMKGLAVKFAEDINIEVLREKYADEHAVGVIGWFEFDSKVENAQQIAKLVCKA